MKAEQAEFYTREIFVMLSHTFHGFEVIDSYTSSYSIDFIKWKRVVEKFETWQIDNVLIQWFENPGMRSASLSIFERKAEQQLKPAKTILAELKNMFKE